MNNMNIQTRNRQSGFTLIELVIVIVVLGILAAIAIPRFVDLSDEAEEAVCDGAVGALISSAAIQIAAPPVGEAADRATIIGQTILDGAMAASGTAAGVIEVTVGGTTCETPDLLDLGLSSD